MSVKFKFYLRFEHLGDKERFHASTASGIGGSSLHRGVHRDNSISFLDQRPSLFAFLRALAFSLPV